MSKPVDQKDLQKMQQQYGNYEAAKMVRERTAKQVDKFRSASGGGSAAEQDSAAKRRKEEEETTLGELRRKYGIR